MANFDYFPDLEDRRHSSNQFIKDTGLRVFHAMDDGIDSDRFCIVYDCPKNSSMVTFAIAMVNPHDQYHRAIGRTLAAERFAAGQTVTISVDMLNQMISRYVF